jgi:hypothetical protein
METEIVLPEQFWGRPATPTGGVVGLLWAVLVDGVLSYREAVMRGETRSLEFREIENWLIAVRPQYLTSFESLCSIFGIEPSCLRLELLRFRREMEAQYERQAS